jgi:hypothetical protein
VTIDEEKAPFEQALSDMHVDHLKTEILQEARRTCEHLLRTSNVRLVWRVPPMNEALPAHVPANQVVVLTLRGQPPGNKKGRPPRSGCLACATRLALVRCALFRFLRFGKRASGRRHREKPPKKPPNHGA